MQNLNVTDLSIMKGEIICIFYFIVKAFVRYENQVYWRGLSAVMKLAVILHWFRHLEVGVLLAVDAQH